MNKIVISGDTNIASVVKSALSCIKKYNASKIFIIGGSGLGVSNYDVEKAILKRLNDKLSFANSEIYFIRHSNDCSYYYENEEKLISYMLTSVQLKESETINTKEQVENYVKFLKNSNFHFIKDYYIDDTVIAVGGSYSHDIEQRVMDYNAWNEEGIPELTDEIKQQIVDGVKNNKVSVLSSYPPSFCKPFLPGLSYQSKLITPKEYFPIYAKPNTIVNVREARYKLEQLDIFLSDNTKYKNYYYSNSNHKKYNLVKRNEPDEVFDDINYYNINNEMYLINDKATRI